MSNEFTIKHLQDQIKTLSAEQETLNRSIVKARQDEQIEIDQMRRSYSMRIATMESRQAAVDREITGLKRNLYSLEKQVEKEELRKAADEAEQKAAEAMRRNLRK